MVRVHPHPPGRGSSVVEQRSEEPRVASPILALGTIKTPSQDGVFIYWGNTKTNRFHDSFLVGPTGIEPATSWSQTRRATSCATARGFSERG